MNAEFPLPQTDGHSARKSRVKDWLVKRRWFALFVILPTLLAAAYYALLAPAVYVSVSHFVLTSPDDKRRQTSSLANLIQTTGLSGGQEQARQVLEYVKSRDALRALASRTDAREMLSPKGFEPVGAVLSLFSKNTFENLFEDYSAKVKGTIDNESGTARLEVKAYTPKDAYDLNRELLSMSEALVNRLNERARLKAISEAQKQVDIAAERARSARVAMEQYRNSRDILDPAAQGVGVIELSETLIGQRAVMQAQLDTMARLTPRNPAIPALRDRIAALSAQIASQGGRIAGTNNGLASKLGGYENLKVEEEFATKSLEAASASLVQASADAQRQQYYLERIVEPNLPDEARLPRRLLNVIIVGAIALCLYFIGWMLIVGILEHAPEE